MCGNYIVWRHAQMAALPGVIYTTSKADEAFLEALREDIDAAATGAGQPAKVHGFPNEKVCQTAPALY